MKPVEFPALHDSRYPVHRLAHQLEPYLHVIVNRFHPEKIILFGSQAYGAPTKDSDFDLLVIRSNIESEKKSNIELRHAIWDVDAPPTSFTFLSQTPQSLDQKLQSGSFVYREIIEKGVELYAAEKNERSGSR
jgi:hypothetical protein